MLVKSEAWKQAASNHFHLSSPLTTTILEGDNFIDTALNYIRRNTFDLVAIPRDIKELTGMKKSNKKDLEQLIDNINLPVLLY